MLAASLGWLGTIGTFVAYLLLWRGRLSPQSRRYALLNVVGGLMAGAASASYGAWPSVVSNVVWAAVGIQSVVSSEVERHRAAVAAQREAAADLVLRPRRWLRHHDTVCSEADAA